MRLSPFFLFGGVQIVPKLQACHQGHKKPPCNAHGGKGGKIMKGG